MKGPSRFALLVALAAFAAAPAWAITAANNTLKSPIAKPLSAWLVGPSQASSFDAKEHPDDQGCLMVTEFENGMILGIHARAAGIVGMTVDTKKQGRQPGDPASVGLNVGQNSYVMNAVATDSSTLALDLTEAGGGKDLVERLTTLGSFRLLIDEQPYYFSTTGFTDGLARLLACMGGTMAVPLPVQTVKPKLRADQTLPVMRVTSSGLKTPIALALANLIPVGFKFKLEDVDPMTPISWQPGDDWVEVMGTALEPRGLKMAVRGDTVTIMQRGGADEPVIDGATTASNQRAMADALQPVDDTPAPDARVPNTMQDMPTGVWAGAKGESLANVLDAWGLMAGVNVKLDLAGDLRLPQDVRYDGRFDDAVQSLLAQYTGKDKPVGLFGDNAKVAAASSRMMQQAPVADEAPAPKSPRQPAKIFKPRTVAEIKADAPKQDYSWAPLSQMAPVPEGSAKPAKIAKPAKSAKTKAPTNWEALQGTSLRDVLEHWGDKAGVTIVYLADETFPLPSSVKQKGNFEDAVTQALGKYTKNSGPKPQAQLNNDPKTGQRALIIKAARS